MVRDYIEIYKMLEQFQDFDFTFLVRHKIMRNKDALKPLIELIEKESKTLSEEEILDILNSDVIVKLDAFTLKELEKSPITQFGIRLFSRMGLLDLGEPLESATIKKKVSAIAE